MALAFLDQVAQGLFADDREHDLAHDPVGVIEGGPGELEEEVLLAADALQVVEQFAVHAAFGPRSDLVDGLGQEVDQVVGQLAATEVHEGREPGEPRRFGVSPQLMGGLDRDTPSIPFQFLGKHLVEQVGGQPDPADQLQPGQLGLDAGEARPTRIATQLEKECGGRSRLSVAVRTALRVAFGLQQRFQAGTGLRRQTVSNAGIEAVPRGHGSPRARSARRGPPTAVRSPARGSGPRAAPPGDRGPRRPPPPDRGASLRAPRRRRPSLRDSRTGRGSRRDGVRPSGPTGSAHGPRAPGRELAARPRPAICRSISEPSAGNRPCSRKNSSNTAKPSRLARPLTATSA